MYKAIFFLVLFSLLSSCIQTANKADADSQKHQNIPGDIQGNTPPSLRGQGELIIQYTEEFQYQLSAYDVDGDPLIITLANQPSWMQFDQESMLISGQPTFDDVGIYSGIYMSVFDGTDTTRIGPITIHVVEKLYELEISWEHSFEDVNNDPISNLAGYIISWGPSPDQLNNKQTVPTANTFSSTVSRIPSGRYYFSMTAVLENAVQSDPSNLISVDVGVL
jgi:hypothetical protein